MDVAFPTALMKASAAALLAGGRGSVLLIHASAVVKPLYSPGIYRAGQLRDSPRQVR